MVLRANPNAHHRVDRCVARAHDSLRCFSASAAHLVDVGNHRGRLFFNLRQLYRARLHRADLQHLQTTRGPGDPRPDFGLGPREPDSGAACFRRRRLTPDYAHQRECCRSVRHHAHRAQ